MSRNQADVYTENVLAALPPDLRRTLNRKQLGSLRQALSRVNAQSRHVIDMRFSIPLFFARYYFILVLGRDKRNSIQRLLMERRVEGSRVATVGIIVLIAVFLLLGLVTASALILYIIKSHLGIDIFPNKHLLDFISF